MCFRYGFNREGTRKFAKDRIKSCFVCANPLNNNLDFCAGGVETAYPLVFPWFYSFLRLGARPLPENQIFVPETTVSSHVGLPSPNLEVAGVRSESPPQHMASRDPQQLIWNNQMKVTQEGGCADE